MKRIKSFLIIFITMFTFLAGTNIVNAESANIKVTSSASSVVVGRTFNVTVTISSSAFLGTWEYSMDYNSNVLKLVSGNSTVVDFSDGTKKSVSYNYQFKAISNGTSNISVKAYNVLDYQSESKCSVTVSSSSVKVITQAELEASYSKDNTLKSITVDGATLEPTFDPKVYEYKVNLDSNTEKVNINATPNDSKASVTGTGEVEVSEGDNRVELICTAENGSTLKYALILNVVDPSPINVNINDKNYVVVKRKQLLEAPKTFTETTIKINDVDIPAFYSEITKFTLVGLKDETGNIEYFIYDEENDSYVKYNEILFNSLTIYPLDIDEEYKNYNKYKLLINDIEVNGLKISEKSKYALIKGTNIETNETEVYVYDEENNTLIKYYDDEVSILNNKIELLTKIMLVLGIETFVISFWFIIFLIKNGKNNNKKKSKKKKNKKSEIEL